MYTAVHRHASHLRADLGLDIDVEPQVDEAGVQEDRGEEAPRLLPVLHFGGVVGPEVGERLDRGPLCVGGCVGVRGGACGCAGRASGRAAPSPWSIP